MMELDLSRTLKIRKMRLVRAIHSAICLCLCLFRSGEPPVQVVAGLNWALGDLKES